MVTETLPTTRSISEHAISALAGSLSGNLIEPGDAGYEEAVECARDQGLNLPMLSGTT